MFSQKIRSALDVPVGLRSRHGCRRACVGCYSWSRDDGHSHRCLAGPDRREHVTALSCRGGIGRQPDEPSPDKDGQPPGI